MVDSMSWERRTASFHPGSPEFIIGKIVQDTSTLIFSTYNAYHANIYSVQVSDRCSGNVLHPYRVVNDRSRAVLLKRKALCKSRAKKVCSETLYGIGHATLGTGHIGVHVLKHVEMEPGIQQRQIMTGMQWFEHCAYVTINRIADGAVYLMQRAEIWHPP
nr:hypothetical protein CFP56_12878 [Quercus suber]